MNRVVSFLSMLCNEEENNGVRRMLGVCSEFERIAKIVLDKADNEAASRRKRKSHHDEPKKKVSERTASSTTSPQPNSAAASSNPFTPAPSLEADSSVRAPL